ncbi:MAG: 50S ribosomal protein L9 [Ruminococcaceae bacterium]|nr:50S ribosomal protein L9 [Oscillospiraceae bacterium]
MKIYLKQDVKGQGKKGQIVEVSDGYARNFLLPKGLGVIADAKLENEVKNSQSSQAYRQSQELAAAKELAAKIEKITLEIVAEGGCDGRLYGGITNAHVAEYLSKQHGISVDKRKISMDAIKAFGELTAELKLYNGVSADLKIRVIPKN